MLRHTALKSGKVQEASPCERFEDFGITAFRWDLFDGWSPEHLKGDGLCMEIPWRRGFDVFEKRAGAKEEEGRNHRNFVKKVMQMLSEWKHPAVLFHGKEILNEVSGHDARFESTLYGGDCMVSVYNCRTMPEFKTDLEINQWLTDKSRVLVNPVCGYGRTARLAKEAGKRSIVSDYNASCIGYIRDNWGQW